LLDKTYRSEEQENHRKSIFAKNADKVKKHNGAGASYTLELNQFADLTVEEFVATYTGFKEPKNKTVYL
jgi:hypothetical protein